MKDFIIRILISSIVGAVVSAGILYFAFDQSLRGMETSISSVNNQISENGEWLRHQNSKLEDIQSTLDQKLGEIASKIDISSLNSKTLYAKYSYLQKDVNDEIVMTYTITSDLLTLMLDNGSLSEADRARGRDLLTRLAQSQAYIKERSQIVQQANFELAPQPIQSGD